MSSSAPADPAPSALSLFDSATGEQRPFVPRTAGRVGLYVCGATVQGGPHVGHLRTSLSFDILVRWLTHLGFEVTHVQNVTDIDDKILAKAAEAGAEWWAWAQRFEREFRAAYAAIGVLDPTYEPRATGHVPDMIELMILLKDRGHAYVTGEGDVFFDVPSFPEYGALTRQGTGEVIADEEDAHGKRDPRDFALWKAPKDGEPASAAWETPFGRGRPGWHLECSAMARRYLGDAFDIHGGGIDLRFPHHENEQAQSRAAGMGFAGLWMHTGWVTQSGVKMSKSLGNALSAEAILAEHPGQVLRYALLAAHYRSMLEFSPATMADAEAAWERLVGFVRRATTRVGEVPIYADEAPDAGGADGASAAGGAPRVAVELPADFVAAMNDDLNVPLALAVVHEHTRLGNTALADADLDEVRTQVTLVRGMLAVLGLDPVRWGGESKDSQAYEALGALVESVLAERAAARQARDFAAADAIRDQLAAAGIAVEDSPAGPRWSLADRTEPHSDATGSRES